MAPTAPAATGLGVRATAAERSVVVHGNVGGSIVLGDGNWIVNDNHGTIVAETVVPTRTRRPRAGPPRAPAPFVGRTAEQVRLTGLLSARQPVTVSGAAGAGRTALMRAAANRPELDRADGVLRIDGVDDAGRALSIDDLAQRLHDAAWETVPAVKVDAGSARSQLGGLDAIAIVDDVALPGPDLERLADLLPLGAVMIATGEARPDSEFEDVAIGGLDRADAVVLLAARAGLARSEATDDDLDAICALLGDWPEALVVAGRAIAVRSITPPTARTELATILPGVAPAPPVAVERAWGLARPALDPNARRLLAAAAALPGRTHDPAILRRVLDGPAWFEAAAATLDALGLLTLNSPRLRMPDGIRALVRDGAVTLVPDIADRHLDVMLEVARERALDPDFAVDELGGLLGAMDHAVRRGRLDGAVRLGRAVAPRLVLNGLWDAWRAVALEVRAAATRTNAIADVAWAAHELGTRDLAVGDIGAAGPWLHEALDLRRSIGDTEGAAYTIHNMVRFGLATIGGEGGGGGGGGGVARWLFGGAALIVGLALLAIVGPPAAALVAEIIGPAETAEPSPSPTPDTTPTTVPTAPPSVLPGLAVVTSVGDFSFDGPAWFTTLEVTLSGGVGQYTITIDGVGESTDNPAVFRIEGVVCEARQVTGTAGSGSEIKAPMVVDVAPTSCPSPTPTPISEACVTFDDVPVGTTYGGESGQKSGDEILRTPEGIRVSVVDFLYSTEGGTFKTLTVFEPSPDFGAGPYVWFNNINVEFDYSALPFVPSAVEFAFRDQGGNENLSVNGSEVYRNDLWEAPSPIGGVSWSWADPDGDRSATGTLKGTVDRFLIGGQEFSLDTVCAFR